MEDVGSPRAGGWSRRWPLTAAWALLCLPWVVGCPTSSPAHHQKKITVFAAASTANLLPKIARAFEKAHPNTTVRMSFGASSFLARQVLAGAPADVFLSANERWMDVLEEEGRLRPSTRLDVLTNHLVIVAAKSSTWTVALRPGLDLAEAAGGRVALADPAHVPAGLYARHAFEALKGWASLESHIVATTDVRAALRMVELGETPAGIVYETDARASDRIRVVQRIPNRLSGRIRYPAAAMAGAAEEAATFVRFLLSPAARREIEAAGFFVPREQHSEPHTHRAGSRRARSASPGTP